MAQKVTTTLVDDLDGATIEDGAGRTVSFSFDGAAYEIDLSDKNLAAFREVLSEYIAAARRTSGVRRGARRPGRGGQAEDLGAIREWASANGHEVSGRGRIAQSVKDAYYEASK